ncbi:FxsA family protein [Micrococcales bacterium 31B]|nr:FxsA family protein [Micrococcales bacterium 31B]
MNLVRVPVRIVSVLAFVWLLIEIALLWWIGTHGGVLAVWGVIVGGIVLGGLVMRGAGRTATSRMNLALRGEYEAGTSRSAPVFRFIAGLLLFVPGVLNTVIGLILLLPPVQRGVRRLLLGWFTAAVPLGGASNFGAFGPGFGPAGYTTGTRSGAGAPSDDIIDGEIVPDAPGTRPSPGPRSPGGPSDGPKLIEGELRDPE